MWMSVDIHVYDIDKLKEEFSKVLKKEDSEIMLEAMSKSWIVLDNKYFVLQSCDYWNEYSPWNAMLSLYRRLSKLDDDYELFDSCQVDWKYEWCNVYDLWDEERYWRELPEDTTDEDEQSD